MLLNLPLQVGLDLVLKEHHSPDLGPEEPCSLHSACHLGLSISLHINLHGEGEYTFVFILYETSICV